MEEDIRREESSTIVNSAVESRKRFNSGPYVVGILLFLVICLLFALTYFILKDNGINLFSNETATTESTNNSSSDTTGTKNTDNSSNNESAENDDSTVTSSKVGTFKVAFSFPSEGVPAVRLCFTDTSDMSKQYCFWEKGSNDTKTYTNDLKNGSGTLPVGTYIVDYTVYSHESSSPETSFVYQVYALRQCAYYADGGENNSANVAKYCKGVTAEFDKYKVITEG